MSHISGTDHTRYEYITDCCGACKIAKETNPDPSQWTLLDHYERGSLIALKVSYNNIDKSKFEKVKVLVIRDSMVGLIKNRKLDPHFAKDGRVVARFAPTDAGWGDAKNYVSLYNSI